MTAEDNFLIDRVKNLSEDKIEGTHYTLKDMKRRLKQYRVDNNSVVGEFSVTDFFAQNNLAVHFHNVQSDN